MLSSQGAIPKRWIVICTFSLLIIYLYHHAPALRKPKPPDKHPSKQSKETKDGLLEKGTASGRSASQMLSRSIEGLESWTYNPYPKYNSPEWSQKWKGVHVPCVGPRGVPVNGEPEDMLRVYHAWPKGSTDEPLFGSYEDTGLNSTTCFSSGERYRPYGYTEDDDNGAMVKATAPSNVIWEDVNWGKLQKKCIMRNQDRYENVTALNQDIAFRYAEYADIRGVDETLYFPKDHDQSKRKRNAQERPKNKTRTAIVFEVQESREWTLDTTQYVRSMIMELSLHTGGEYEVLILIEVSDDSEPIFNNPGVYHKIIERSVPREFREISFLFNRKLMKHWYPKVPRKTSDDFSSNAYAPLQLLSLSRPDLEFFWLMDVDARYTGHHYDHLETISAWSKAQSREVLWELSSQLYMREIHKSWKDFASKVRSLARKATIRGPLRAKGIEPVGPQPPMMLSGKDRWGIGEEADLITLGPVFDPKGSSFQGKADIANYPEGAGNPPQRATAFSTITRTSKRLLRAMHHGQLTLGTHMPPTLFPASTALHHGLKVVAFPLPIFLDATVSPEQIEAEFNHPDWGRHTYDTPYKYADFWRRMTFAISVDELPTFADELYKRWLGYDPKQTRGLCLPGLLLRPVHGV